MPPRIPPLGPIDPGRRFDAPLETVGPVQVQPVTDPAVLEVDVVAEARPDIDAVAMAFTPPPLLLAPLRLEYRIVDEPYSLTVEQASAETAQTVVQAQAGRASLEVGPPPVAIERGAAARLEAGPRQVLEGAPLAVRGDLVRGGLKAEDRRPFDPGVRRQTRKVIRFRWYPGEDFAEGGVTPIMAHEAAALEVFNATLAAVQGPGAPPHWYDPASPVATAAWQVLVRAVRPARALHFLRNPELAQVQSEPDATTAAASRAGRIAMLPAQVVLFAVQADGTIAEIGRGGPVADDVRYDSDALNDGTWLIDFDAAVGKGMACRIVDADKIALALGAQTRWVVAVGLHVGDAKAEVDALLRDAIANGNFAFLPQDTATNNTPGNPTLATDPRNDIPAFLADATDVEHGRFAADTQSAADLLAKALNLDPAMLRRARGAADTGFENAAAMLRLIGPALVDANEQAPEWPGFAAGGTNRLIDIMASGIVARGPLPTVRLGKNPYGVLPVTLLGEYATDLLADPVDAAIEDELVKIANLVKGFKFGWGGLKSVPIGPSDPATATKLTELLQRRAVSTKITVAAAGSSDTRVLGCPYVSSAVHKPVDYLADLSAGGTFMPEPDASNAAWPLLYRLARMAYGRMPHVHSRGGDLVRGPGGNIQVQLPAFSAPPSFLKAIERLQAVAAERDGDAKLEVLLMETFDVFATRFDARVSGLAHRRITKRRADGEAGLAGGYWGLLQKLSETSATGATDGYIQAPSVRQATAAAIMRAANLRQDPGGPFAIDLSSERMRRAMMLLDRLDKGLSLAEILGQIGEGLLHLWNSDMDIAPLRAAYPLHGSGSGAQPFDARAFLKTPGKYTPAADRSANNLPKLAAALAADLDALADLTVAEAVYQRTIGQPGAANAWMQVLSGHPVPGEPAFPRLLRPGQGLSYRTSILLPAAANNEKSSPRALAEPALAKLAQDYLGDLSKAQVSVTIAPPGAASPVTLQFGLTGDLGMEAIDVMYGGEAELGARALDLTLRRWSGDADITRSSGEIPYTNLPAWLAGVVSVALSADKTGELMVRAARLRELVQQSRELQPSDLNNGASTDHPLTEAVEAQLLFGSAQVLAQRASALCDRVRTAAEGLESALSPAVLKCREYYRAVLAPLGREEEGSSTSSGGEPSSSAAVHLSPEQTRMRKLAEVQERLADLRAALTAASWFGEPGCLRPIGAEDAGAAPDDLDMSVRKLIQRMTGKADALEAAVAGAGGAAPSTAGAARAALTALVSALQDALGGDGFAILPPCSIRDETLPVFDRDPGAYKKARDTHNEWAGERPRLGPVAAVVDPLKLAFIPNTGAATGLHKTLDDKREEAIAPKTRFFGCFIADRTWLLGSEPPAACAGFVIDEWADQQPSRDQTTGVALNTNAPQAQAPNCLLLCEAPSPAFGAWDEAKAARMVLETIQWMQVRAEPPQPDGNLAVAFKGANLLPPLDAEGGPVDRLPTSLPVFEANMASHSELVGFLKVEE